MNKEEVLILISRLFTGYGKTPGKEQLDEWVKQQRRFNWRADDMSAAIDSLLSTQNRFPTIAEFRTAVQSVVIQRTTQSGAPAPKPGWLVKSENEWRTEDFEWWHARFGSLAPQAKALIGEACSKGKARLALTIAKLINEMHKENLPFTDRWERLKAHTAGTTYTITPPARVAASTFEEF